MSSSKSPNLPSTSKGRLQAASEQYSLSATVSEPAPETEPRNFTISSKGRMRLETAQDDSNYEQLGAREWQVSEREHERVLDEIYAERNDLEKMYDELKGLKGWKQCSTYKDLELRIQRENKGFAQRKAERGGGRVEGLRG
ncbi:MAG: hypothetical protein Q9192_007007, partial [Flavoplaca navasiana]